MQVGLKPGTTMTVEIDFFVDTPLVDLDNLAKPVLDTLFEPNPNDNQKKLRDVAGVLFPIPDESVTRLVLTKTVVSDPSTVGAEISATW